MNGMKLLLAAALLLVGTHSTAAAAKHVELGIASFVYQQAYCKYDYAHAVAVQGVLDQDMAQQLFMEGVSIGKCGMLPKNVKITILEVGDMFVDTRGIYFLVRVSETLWSWAWPGINSDLTHKGEAQGA